MPMFPQPAPPAGVVGHMAGDMRPGAGRVIEFEEVRRLRQPDIGGDLTTSRGARARAKCRRITPPAVQLPQRVWAFVNCACRKRSQTPKISA